MSITFERATLQAVGLFIAIAGSSRTGKTYTALRVARGIAGPNGRIAAIDTEGKRMSHYSKEFQFDVVNMKSPFTPIRFVEAAQAAEAAGYDALVIDSFSLEWSGVGGVLHRYDELFEKAGFDQRKSDVCWARAKAPHKAMMNELIQLTIPIIFCLRANEVPIHLGGGWKVEQDKRFLYEWTVALTLHPDTPGMPRFDLVDAKRKPLWKVSDIHRHLFPEGKLITEDVGAALQSWRNSGDARAAGSDAVQPKKQSASEWLEELSEYLDRCETREAVEAVLSRETTQKALSVGSDTLKARINALARSALDRTTTGGMEFAPADATATGEAA